MILPWHKPNRFSLFHLPSKSKTSPYLNPLAMKTSLLLLATMLVGISCNKEPQFVTHENTTV